MSRNKKLLKLSDETQKTANQERLHRLNQMSIHPNSSHQTKTSITLFQWKVYNQAFKTYNIQYTKQQYNNNIATIKYCFVYNI